MMRFAKVRCLVLATLIGLCTVSLLNGLLRSSPVLASDPKQTAVTSLDVPIQPPPPKDDWIVIVVFTDPVTVPVLDLNGAIVGEGVHLGRARCRSTNCNQRIELGIAAVPTTTFSIEYQFTTRQAFDPTARRVVMSGKGTRTGISKKEKFAFTATFSDNSDGTILVIYQASRPGASFMIPRTPGSLTFQQ